MKTECILLKSPKYGNFDLYLEDGKPLFNALRIAKFLNYVEPYNAIFEYVDTKDRFQRLMPNTSVLAKDTWIMNIDGLYSLVSHSECGFAKDFIDWITGETLSWMGKLEAFDKKFRNGARIVNKSQILDLSKQKPQKQDVKIQDLLQEVKELKKAMIKIGQQLELFTSPEEKTSEKSRILAIKEMIRKYQRLIGGEPEEIWNKAFKDLYSKYGISVDSIKEIKEDESGLSKLVRKGHLEELEIILFEMIRDGGVN